jgi:acyl-coenzyme A synthetase/AMP-(fatty) acid ligase
MTFDHIARHAAARPGAIAIVNNGFAISYEGLARAVAQFTQALGGLGLRPGQAALVQSGDLYLNLLILLGFERLGVATTSILANELEKPDAMLDRYDLVVTEHPGRAKGARRVMAITRPWVESALALPPAAGDPVVALPDPVVRIVRTSGTTGAAKRAALRRRTLEGRLGLWTGFYGPAPRNRSLVATAFTFSTAYLQAIGALRAGATLVFENRIEMHEAIALHGITDCKMLPLQLLDLIDRLPADFVKPPSFDLVSLGGPIGPALRDRVLARLASRLRDVYGANETGPVSERIEDGASPQIGTVLPDVDVEIVDEQGRPLPDGQAGEIRIRTPYMADGYLDDPETTARMFKDGWFHPGDLGIRHGPGRLQIVGRVDDIMNVGGVKVLPDAIEERIRERAAVEDVAVCALPNRDGIDEVWVAVVYDAPDDRDIRTRMRAALVDFPYGQVHLAKLARIPRTDTGKVRRAALRDELIVAQSRSESGR